MKEEKVMKYVAKKYLPAIKEARYFVDEYEIVLNRGYTFERNNTFFYSQTIKELKNDLKKIVKHESDEDYVKTLISMGYKLEEIEKM